MECSQIREALSAAMDGEPSNVADREIDVHLRRCGPCREFATHAVDYAPRVVAAAKRDRLLTPFWMSPVRILLGSCAITQLMLAVPDLFGRDEGAPVHIAHEVGVWDAALAVGLLFAAWRPLRAVGMLPFVAALASGLLLTAVIDLASGHAIMLMESEHLLELAGTALLWILVGGTFPALRTTIAPSVQSSIGPSKG